MQAGSDDFLATVTESVVHGVYKVSWSCFGLTWQRKVSGGIWTFGHSIARSYTNLGQ